MDPEKPANSGDRILCIGIDALLLETRRMLLASHGYRPETSLPGIINPKLLADTDLVVISVSVSREDRTRILAMIPDTTPRLVLETLVTPVELLRLIDDARRSANAYTEPLEPPQKQNHV